MRDEGIKFIKNVGPVSCIIIIMCVCRHVHVHVCVCECARWALSE